MPEDPGCIEAAVCELEDDDGCRGRRARSDECCEYHGDEKDVLDHERKWGGPAMLSPGRPHGYRRFA